MNNIYTYILVMAITTYIIRLLPLVLFKNEIKSNYIKSFLYYVPYVCLAAMTFPAIINETTHMISGIIAFIIAIIGAYKERSLILVALYTCVCVFIVESIIRFL